MSEEQTQQDISDLRSDVTSVRLDVATLRNDLENLRKIDMAQHAGMKEEVIALRKDIQDLVSAWNGAKGLVSFVKGLAIFVAAVFTALVAAKTIFKW